MDIRQKEIQRLKEIKRKTDLTKEDLEFIYNIHSHITDNDVYNAARLMTTKRDKAEDLAIIFDCTKDEIGFNEGEFKDGKVLKYFESSNTLHHIKIRGEEELNKINFPEYINGSIDIMNVKIIHNLKFSKDFKGELNIKDTIFMDNIVLPEKISLSLRMRRLNRCNRVIFPKNIYGPLMIDSLESLDGITIPSDFDYTKIVGKLSLDDFKAKQKVKK